MIRAATIATLVLSLPCPVFGALACRRGGKEELALRGKEEQCLRLENLEAVRVEVHAGRLSRLQDWVWDVGSTESMTISALISTAVMESRCYGDYDAHGQLQTHSFNFLWI